MNKSGDLLYDKLVAEAQERLKKSLAGEGFLPLEILQDFYNQEPAIKPKRPIAREFCNGHNGIPFVMDGVCGKCGLPIAQPK